MSNLLERAIIDAKALKEAALKNAEQLVIQKYSEEVKNAVNQLLSEAPGDDPGAIDALGMDDPTGDPMADPMADLGMGTEESPEGEGPTDPEQEESALDRESVLGTLPDAFSGDDDEVITIKLDSLEAEYEDEETNGRFGGEDKMADDHLGIDILDDEEPLEADDEVDLDIDTDQDFSSEPEADVGIDITESVLEEILSELDLNEEEIDLDELMERVRVDFEPQKSGWAGTPEPQMREYESMLLAREQDTEVKEENEALRKTVKALKQENKTLTSAAKKLQIQTEKYETAFETLQEKLETMNVSNAKLLYINQALENASLNERQKRKIVEAISKAETVQEAKIVFETMNDTVTTALDARRESTLNEMVSRKSTLLVSARGEQKEQDANPLYSRMQKLAGIKAKKS